MTSATDVPVALFRHIEHDAEPRFAAQHAIVSLVDAFQRIHLVHRAYVGQHAKAERILRIDRDARVPPLHRAGTHQQEQRLYIDRLDRPDDHQGALGSQAADDRTHGRAVRHGCQNGFGSAQLGEFCRRSLTLVVDVTPGSHFLRERLLVLAAGDGDGFEAHFDGVLHAQMTEAADAKDGNNLARSSPAISQGVEGGDAGTHQRRRSRFLTALREPARDPTRGRSCSRHSHRHASRP